MKDYVIKYLQKIGGDREKASKTGKRDLELIEKDEEYSGVDRKELLNRFLELAIQPDGDSMRSSWLDATNPPPPPDPTKPLPKMTDNDWLKLQRDAKNTRKGLEALKTKVFFITMK